MKLTQKIIINFLDGYKSKKCKGQLKIEWQGQTSFTEIMTKLMSYKSKMLPPDSTLYVKRNLWPKSPPADE